MAWPLPRPAQNACRRCSPSLNAHKRAQALPEVWSGIAYPTAVCNAVIRRVAPFALAVALSLPTCVQAAEQVGNFGASGFIFKDSVEVVAVEDPDGEAFCFVHLTALCLCVPRPLRVSRGSGNGIAGLLRLAVR